MLVLCNRIKDCPLALECTAHGKPHERSVNCDYPFCVNVSGKTACKPVKVQKQGVKE